MRTSLSEIEQLENWVFREGDAQDRLVTEAKLLTNNELREKLKWQSVAYDAIHHYGRQKLLEEIRAVESKLFRASAYRAFQEKIRSIFK